MAYTRIERLGQIHDELERANVLFPRKQVGPHEGYAVLLEEVDELWETVKSYKPSVGVTSDMRKEAIQVAAMALRFVEDVCDGQ